MTDTTERGVLRRDVLAYGLFAMTTPAFAQPASTGEIVSCAIHPAIGFARAGNSPTEFFYGPELPGAPPAPQGGFKDAQGRMRRQAVRFRIFGYDRDGRVVREITAADAEIEWTVEVANLKAASLEFHMPMDIPEARARQGAPFALHRRNAEITGAQRGALAIRPGPRSLRGANGRAVFDSGRFMGQPVPLGEMRTDARGRLTFLGGFGNSFSNPTGSPLHHYANNDGWCDDTSDGPVEATVRIGGRDVPVQGAWVVSAPPSYAPGVTPVISLYDTIYAASGSPRDHRPSFTREVYPIFARLAQHQWVNAGFAREFGHGGQFDFASAAMIARLADASAGNRAFRQDIFSHFRSPLYVTAEEHKWPPYYGDQSGSAREHQAMLPHQFAALRRWAGGDFDADMPADGIRFAAREEDIPPGELPAALDRAQLDAASGAPFHPGIECGWVVRNSPMYEAPFRFKRRPEPERDWGDEVTQAMLLAPGGPLGALAPGGLSRWMGVPWQADAINCGAGYDADYDPYVPTYWPAIIPNDMFREDQYRALMEARSPEAVAQVLNYRRRHKWVRGYDDGMEEPYLAFQQRWFRFGVARRQPGPQGGPAEVWVEMERSQPEPPKWPTPQDPEPGEATPDAPARASAPTHPKGPPPRQ